MPFLILSTSSPVNANDIIDFVVTPKTFAETNHTDIMSERTERQSNIELLRVFAALGVVLLHYNNSSIGTGFANALGLSANQFVLVFFESIFICTVNLFVLISGYFMKGSSKADLLKPVKLLSMYVVFELIAYLIKELPKGEPFSISTFADYFSPSYWFIFVYIALYILSPYLNLLWSHLDRKKQKQLLIILITLFSVYPIAWEIITYASKSTVWGADSVSSFGLMQGISTIGLFGSGAGYTITNFILMYLIGCYLKCVEEDGKKFKTGKLVILLVVNVALIIYWAYVEMFVNGGAIDGTTGWYYESPLVISEAVLLFLIFKNMKIKKNKVINVLAAASFPTYLIHINLLEYFNIATFVQGNTFILILHVIGSAIAIYLISFAIYELYDLITKPLFKAISKKWQKKRYIDLSDQK